MHVQGQINEVTLPALRSQNAIAEPRNSSYDDFGAIFPPLVTWEEYWKVLWFKWSHRKGPSDLSVAGNATSWHWSPRASVPISLIYLPRLWSRQLRCRFRRESWETWGREDQGWHSRSGKGIIGWSRASNPKGWFIVVQDLHNWAESWKWQLLNWPDRSCICLK
jgi:hypothetical protein